MSPGTARAASSAFTSTSRRRRKTLLTQRRIGVAAVVMYLVGTFILTHMSLKGTMLDHENFPSQFQIVDKIYHFCSYFVLAFLVLSFFTIPSTDKKQAVRVRSAKQKALWCAIIVIYGIFDELTQPYFGRRLEVLDLLANCVGISFAQVLFVVFEASGLRRTMWKWK